MSHEHETCARPECSEGMIFGPCYEECPSEDCTVVGHCDCKCHSGKVCACGHTWPKMPKQVKT